MKNKKTLPERSQRIIKTGLLGVAINASLAILKAIVGILANSIAITLDALNNLSDAASSVVTIIGIKMANRSPDKDHPMGYGRSEYLGTAIIAILISYIGFSAMIESIKKIISPDEVNYSAATILVVVVAIFAKIFLAVYFKRAAKKVDSDSLRGSGTDALLDSVIAFATLVAAIIYLTTGILVEPYLAAVISAIIIIAGFKMLRDSFSTILGERVDSVLAKEIKDEIRRINGVEGVYDLMVHDYGPRMSFASVNIEVVETLSALEIDDITREIRKRIGKKYRINVSSVGVCPVNGDNEKANTIQHEIRLVLSLNEHIRQIHGFHYDEKAKEITFDVIVDFSVTDYHNFKHRIVDQLKKLYPDYKFIVAIDSDFSG